MFRLLLDVDNSVDVKFAKKRRLKMNIFHAIATNHLGSLIFTMQEDSAEVNAKNDEGETPLDWANHCKDIAKVRYLIEKGAK
jgi:ankyrin repeat protein